MALWIMGAIIGADNAEECAREGSQVLSQSACTDARDVGTGIGVIVLWFIWFFGFIILSLIWFMSRPKGRTCPACGEDVKKGVTVCPNCQHDFARAASHEPPQPVTR
jgi:hypothetical protein